MKKFTILLAPLLAVSFLTNCSAAKYTVTFDSNEGTLVAPQTVEANKCAVKPDDPTHEEREDAVYAFKEWQLDGVAFDFATPITKDITLKANWVIAHKYTISVGENVDHLSFTTVDGKPLNTIKAIEKREFKFAMNVIEENEIDYLIPTSIDIKINGAPPLTSSFYKVTVDASGKTAEVTINADKVVGDIVLFGRAAQRNKYGYEVSFHAGLEPIDSGTISFNEILVLQFRASDSYKLPEERDISIEFDDVNGEKKWIIPNGEATSEYCSYDSTDGKLSIRSGHIKNHIDIKARASNIGLLEILGWNEIVKHSFSGDASIIFHVGEEKSLPNICNKVRIVDFNRDLLETSTPDSPQYAGITFEFVGIIADSGVLWSGSGEWDNNNDFINSSSLNTSVQPGGKNFTSASSEITDIAKTVIKEVDTKHDGNWAKTKYKTKLFPLSHDEVSGDKAYTYYIGAKSDKWKKNGTYWLRTPSTDKNWYALSVNDKGGIDIASKVNDPNCCFGVAPGFCV